MKTKAIIGVAILIFAIASCAKRNDINGTWTATPVHIDNMQYAADAFSVLSINFDAPKGAQSGPVTVTMVIDATQPVDSGTTVGFAEPYEVSVTGTATISGRWSYEDGEDDDILLFLDNNSLQINIDPDGVTFSRNLLTGAQQPMIDSLSTVTAERWLTSMRSIAAKQFFEYTKLDDVKVSNDILSCELGKRDLTFHRAPAPTL